MSWLVALLAFAGVMAVLATIVSTLVEFVHKVLALRRSGLEEMLRAMHGGVFLRTGAGERMPPQEERAARQFARSMTRSPSQAAIQPFSSPRRWPLFNRIFQPRFERLTTLQFVEQLAGTDVGRELAAQDRDGLRRELQRAAYQFERYGQSQSDYFRRRAKVISALVAFGFVLIGNVNGFAIYRHLSESPQATASALSFLNETGVGALEAEARATEATLARLEAQLAAAETVDDPGATAAAQAGLTRAIEATREQIDTLRTSVSTTHGALDDAQSLSLPIGATYFPYCKKPDDPRAELAPGCGIDSLTVWSPVGAVMVEDDLGARLLSAQGWWWLLSAIGTAGLLALGAPFWFDLFRSLASLVGPTQRLAGLGRRAAPEGGAPAPAPTAAARALRDAERTDPDAMLEAFYSAQGRSPARPLGDPPPGGRVGESSAQAMGLGGGGSTGGGSGYERSMRRLRD